MRFKKGSKEAKAFMATLRAAKKIGASFDSGSFKVLGKKNNQLVEISESPMTYEDAKKFIKNEGIEKYYSNVDIVPYRGAKKTTKYIGSKLKLTPKETRLGATEKDFKPKSKSYHKDTKSHNVNIRVVSGINGAIINDIKVKYDSLTKWNKVLESLNTELKNTSNKGLKGAIKTDIFRVKNVIKDIKKDISSSQRKVK